MTNFNVVLWNFERNGGGNPRLRERGHELLCRLNPALTLRQELWGSELNGHEILYQEEETLGLRSWLGLRASTAVFADPQKFSPVRDWPDAGPVWAQPPTAVMLRYAPAGCWAMPLCVVSYHLNYASPTARLAEAEMLTTWADKAWAAPDGRVVRLPALLGGDNNSYPEGSLDDDVRLPVLDAIPDLRHRLHRSVDSASGRVMDTRPDATLRMAGLKDVARHWATRRDGSLKALSRTVNASPTHGPDARIDRFYATGDLLEAVAGLDVIEVDEQTSDHHIVRLTLDGDILADLLNNPVAQPSSSD